MEGLAVVDGRDGDGEGGGFGCPHVAEVQIPVTLPHEGSLGWRGDLLDCVEGNHLDVRVVGAVVRDELFVEDVASVLDSEVDEGDEDEYPYQDEEGEEEEHNQGQ